MMVPLVDVVERRRRGQDRSGRQHRAPLDDRAFVDTAIPADQHVVLDDHRQRADRLEHAADLRSGADVHAAADLCARSDERVRIDQRFVANPGADVDVHRRHADDAASRVDAVADAGSAGHDADAAARRQRFERQRVLVEERQRACRPTCRRCRRSETPAGCRASPSRSRASRTAGSCRVPRRARRRPTERRGAPRPTARASVRGRRVSLLEQLLRSAPGASLSRRTAAGQSAASPGAPRRSSRARQPAAAPSAADIAPRAGPSSPWPP